jgi:hypothetical protein
LKAIRLHGAGISRSCLIPPPGSYFLRDLWEEGEPLQASATIWLERASREH